MEFMRKTIVFILLFQVAACVGGVQRKTTSTLSEVIQVCSAHHQKSDSNYFVINADKLEYYIVVSGESLAASGSKNYCHISKASTNLVYANGSSPYVDQGENAIMYQKQYADIASGALALGNVELLRYKFISGQWRYIESKKLSS